MSQGTPIEGIRPIPPEPSILSASRALNQGSQPSGDIGVPAQLPEGALVAPWWAQGVAWRSAACATGYRWPMCVDRTAAPPPQMPAGRFGASNPLGPRTGPPTYDPGGETGDPVKVTAPALEQHNFRPYMIYVPWACEWVVPGTEDDYGYKTDAAAQLEAVTAYNVANELWTATTDLLDADQTTPNPSLMNAATVIDASDAVAPLWAIGRLLEAYSDCTQTAGGATLHIPQILVPPLQQQAVVSQVGATLRGPLGSVVSPGPGYPTEGSFGPDGAVAGEGEAWIYITGPIEVGLGAPRLLPEGQAPHFDRRQNVYQIWAERLAIHRFDPCCVFAVLVAIPNAPTLAS